MSTKTLTVEHPGDHAASQLAIDIAREAAGVPEGAVVTKTVAESGVSSRVTFTFDGDAEPPSTDTSDPTVEDGPVKGKAAKG